MAAHNITRVLDVLSRVYDPDYVDRSIVDMGLVTENDITIQDNQVEVAYGLTAPMCPFSAAIGLMIKFALEQELRVPVSVRLKDEHRQAGVVAELLADPVRCQELMAKLKEFGILERCVRL
ncbi:MAG: iron-sulfur cluster assembly protein [Chloroflexota bacterium]